MFGSILATPMYAAQLAPIYLADQQPTGPEVGKASPIGLVLILLLLAATIFLIRSMSKRIRKLPPSFDSSAGPDAGDAQPAPSDTESPDTSSAVSGTTGSAEN